MDKTYDVLKDIFKILPERIVLSISKLPSEIKENIQEIRLRNNRPVALTCESVTYYLTDKSFTADLFNNLNYMLSIAVLNQLHHINFELYTI